MSARLRPLVALLLCACANPQPPASVVRPRTDIEATPLPSDDKANLIRVRAPTPGARARSPLHVTGVARGPWFFEGTFPVALYDDHRRELARSYARAKGEWMTDDFVPFEADLVFAAGDAREGTLVLERANPAGSLEGIDQLLVPVRLSGRSSLSGKPKRKR